MVSWLLKKRHRIRIICCCSWLVFLSLAIRGGHPQKYRSPSNGFLQVLSHHRAVTTPHSSHCSNEGRWSFVRKTKRVIIYITTPKKQPPPTSVQLYWWGVQFTISYIAYGRLSECHVLCLWEKADTRWPLTHGGSWSGPRRTTILRPALTLCTGRDGVLQLMFYCTGNRVVITATIVRTRFLRRKLWHCFLFHSGRQLSYGSEDGHFSDIGTFSRTLCVRTLHRRKRFIHSYAIVFVQVEVNEVVDRPPNAHR